MRQADSRATVRKLRLPSSAAILGPSLAAVVAATTACSGRVDATSTDTVPTELHTREAYLDTPVVTDDQARAVPSRATRAEVVARLGRSHVVYPRAGRTCMLYPVIGTQRRDPFGSPVADEWELCFAASGQLITKLRITPDVSSAA